jgi:hypothetical protein
LCPRTRPAIEHGERGAGLECGPGVGRGVGDRLRLGLDRFGRRAVKGDALVMAPAAAWLTGETTLPDSTDSVQVNGAIVGSFTDYDGLVEQLRERISALGLSYRVLEEIAGMAEGSDQSQRCGLCRTLSGWFCEWCRTQNGRNTRSV